MTYFSNQPFIIYTIENDKRVMTSPFSRVVTDITERFKYHVSNFIIKSGQRPDTVASDLYGNDRLAWVVLWINNMTYNDWPLTSEQVQTRAVELYGDKINAVRHYEKEGRPYLQQEVETEFVDEDGNTVNWYTPPDLYNTPRFSSAIIDALPVTFMEHEAAVNEAKRQIKVLDKEYIGEFIAAYKKASTS